MENQLRCISHEIRNHVAVCELYTQLAKKYMEQKGFKDKNVDNALECVTKSLKIISNTLFDLRLLDNFMPEKCDIKTLLKDGIDLSLVYIQEKDIEVTLHCRESCNVFIDANKFVACIVNIIKNAIEAIESKGKINIETTISEHNISIKISNNGKKIENPEKIFNEGFTTKKTGSGLGLCICKENLNKQNAEFRLNKSTDKITEFEIILEKC